MTVDLPLAYRWFVKRGLHPWKFDVGDQSRIAWFNKQFRLETGSDHDVRLFARRGDIDDYACFVVRDGKVEDQVITIHLTYANRLETFGRGPDPNLPPKAQRKYPTFMEWVRDIALSAAASWMTEEDLVVDPEL